jgi:hypothetical protein
MDSELEPEMVTPMSAGAEEVDYEEGSPLIDQFNQQNMVPRKGRRVVSQKQQGRDND